MTPDQQPTRQNESPVTRAPAGIKARTGLLIVCVVVIAASVAGALALVRSSPKVSRRPPVKMTPLVQVQAVYPEARTVVIEATGTVVPARELILKSRVAGEVVEVHPEFVQGGVIRKGEQILRVDDLDYQLILAGKQSAVADARFALKVELGRQDVAQREWELLNGSNPAPAGDVELALRKPHLEKARADLAAAEADLRAARLQMARTRISAPFNAVVRETHVERGSQIAVQEHLATLVGTDEFWVQVSLPVDRLQWIDIPVSSRSQGPPVRIFYHGGAVRTGRVMKLLSDLESEGRMARLLVAVKDPLGLEGTPDNLPAMLIGEYVRAAVQGRRIDAAYRIPRTALRDNASIWLVDKDDKLQVQQVTTVWRDSRHVLITDGLQPGARIVTSNLATPVSGMAVRVDDGGRSGAAQPAPAGPSERHQGASAS